MAPEVVLAWACDDGSVSRAFTGAVDIYSFGMMLLYFCNNDKHPYAAFNKYVISPLRCDFFDTNTLPTLDFENGGPVLVKMSPK